MIILNSINMKLNRLLVRWIAYYLLFCYGWLFDKTKFYPIGTKGCLDMIWQTMIDMTFCVRNWIDCNSNTTKTLKMDHPNQLSLSPQLLEF